MWSRDISVCIATGYGLDGLGIESRWGRDFRTRPDRLWGPPSLPYNGYWVFLGGKRLGRGVDHPPPSSAEVKERVKLYLYSPSGPSWPLLGWTLPLPVSVWCKSVPLQAWNGPEGSRKLRFPDFMTTTKGGGKVSLTHRPHLPPGSSPGTRFC